MAQREGSVYLWLFISSFVLFVVMVVLFFLENASKNTLQAAGLSKTKDLNEANQRATKYAEERDALREIVGGTGAAAAWLGDDHYKQKIKEAADFLNDRFKTFRPGPPKTYENVEVAYADYKDLVSKLLDKLQNAQESHKRSEEDKVEVRSTTRTEVKSKEDLIGQLKSQNSETETRYEKKISDLTRDNERLQKELATVKDEMASAEIRSNREKQYCESAIATLKLRLDQLMEESRKSRGIEDVEPDGQVLQVVSSSQIGWVDIGRRQYLRPRLEFQVFQNVKGGKREHKGKIEIRRVDETTSEFRIVDTVDELNPITKGDYITSPFYDPKAVPVFVFAGEGLESRDITEEALRVKMVKNYGVEIRNEVDLKTSFLIALKDYEKSPHYKTARDLGVPVLRERELLEYLGF